MNDEKNPMKPGIPGQTPLHGNNSGGFPYDTQFMKHLSTPSGVRQPNLNMPLPRYNASNAMVMRKDANIFDNLAYHPGLRVQLPSHESLVPPAQVKFEDSQTMRLMMPADKETTPLASSHGHQPQMQFTGTMNYNNSFTPNVMNFNMLNQHHIMKEVGVPQILTYPQQKESLGHVLPNLDNDVNQMNAAMAISQLAKQQITQPLVNPPAVYPNRSSEIMLKYQEKLNIKDETPATIKHQQCTGGIVFDKGLFSQGGRWLVFWECRGRIWRKSFLVNMYGNDGAKELAEEFWISKMRAMQLSNSNRYVNNPGEADGRNPPEYYRKTGHKKYAGMAGSPGYDGSADAEKQPEQMNTPDDPEVFWDADTKSWCYECLDKASNTVSLRRLPVKNPSLMEQVKMEAIRERLAHWRDIIKEYAESEYCGHTYEKSRTCWRVSHWVPSKGINRNKYFNISKYGYLAAKEKSKMYRLLVHDLGGEEPDMPPPEVLPPPEFFDDPVTKFYHRILYSMRSKDKS
ncbi:hypothetical protein X943_001897 [Babesia divergens]|uniref:Uncharacterized protein n=1 Tax=Babesia divergens TaxID=32595 RepID=A0AAD9LJ22_BABDI|nr:hypothetical protein X943_001897 [Babesia divergens]